MKAQGGHTTPGPRSTQRRLESALLRQTADFAALEAEWDELYESCPRATPFQSCAWLYSWWETYGEGYKLRLITLREEGLLVGLLPLMVRRGRLFFLGGVARDDFTTPYKDVLAREGWEGRVAEAGVRALRELGGWWVADLRELRPQAAAWDLFRVWDGPQTTRTSHGIQDSVLIRANSWEELLMSVSRNTRQAARRTLRRAEQDGLRCEPAGPGDDAERAARRLVALHHQLWRGRDIEPEHLTQRWEAFVAAAARRTTARGIGRISEFRRGDSAVLSQFLLFDKDFVGGYAIGASREASRRYQYMTLAIWDAMNVASERDEAYVSMGNWVNQEKLRWADEVVPTHRLFLARTYASWLPYAAYHTLHPGYYNLVSKAQLYAHSENAPGWVKKATACYYALQLFVHSEDAPRWVKKATACYYALRYEYGYWALRYKDQLARARRARRNSTSDDAPRPH